MKKCKCKKNCCTCKIETNIVSDSAGRDGLSAKDIAILSGEFTGTTDQEFLEFIKGDQGIQGEKGDTGNTGITLYTWFRYADDEFGNGISTNYINKPFIGLAFNKISNISSNNPSDYSWSRYKGEKGDKGDKGDVGEQGEQGIQGVPGSIPDLTNLLNRLSSLEKIVAPLNNNLARIWWTGNPSLLPEG